MQRLRITRPEDTGRFLDEAARRVIASAPSLHTTTLPITEARLLLGDLESVRELVRGAQPTPALPLVVARYVMWSGDLHTAAAAWAAVRQALSDVLEHDEHTALRNATCLEVERLATDLGDVQLAARLLGFLRDQRRDAAHDRNGGASVSAPDEDARAVIDTIGRLLGLEPDAARGRLRIRPRLAPHAMLHAEQIRFADAAISISARQLDDAVEYRVEQESGALPVTVLLEPFIGGSSEAVGAIRAEVDGQPAQLSPRIVAGGTILPVQLVLDEERRLFVRAAS